MTEIEQALLTGDILEKYPKDERGESCLIAAKVENKPIHIVCGKRDSRLLIVTVYRPNRLLGKIINKEQRS